MKPLLLALPLLASIVSAQTYDVLIRGGRVLDGTGTPWRQADVAINGDRIVEVGAVPATATARRLIDAQGLYVSPGFIDSHSHAGEALIIKDRAGVRPIVTQGVTTVFINPDGGGPLDLPAQMSDLVSAGPGVNVAPLIGHNTVRIEVLAFENRAPSDGELPELVRVESAEDIDGLIERFTPAFREALDALFDRLATVQDAPCSRALATSLATAGEEESRGGRGAGLAGHEAGDSEAVITESAALAWLELVNRELGRGGTYRGVMAAFEESASGRPELTRRAWYGVFASELAEGKWWQVAYDLDVSGVAVEDFEFGASDGATYGDSPGLQLRGENAAAVETAPRPATRTPRRHYEAWLDYVYYSSSGLRLVAYQEGLTEEQAQLVYRDGDALPNAWHPSDHLPVGCVFEWV